MATEKTILAALEEPVGTTAEDTQTTTTVHAERDEETSAEVTNTMSETFADEEAALAADEAGLEIGEVKILLKLWQIHITQTIPFFLFPPKMYITPFMTQCLQEKCLVWQI